MLSIYALAGLCLLWCGGAFVLAPRSAPRLIGWGAGTLAVVLIGASAALPGVFFDHHKYLGDLWVSFDAAHKTSHGLASSVDYFSPIGPVYDWGFRAALALEPMSARSLPLANAVVAAVVLVLGLAMLWARAGAAMLGLTLLIAIATILTPREPDVVFAETTASWLAPYNRWAAGLAVVVTVALIAPPRGGGPLGDMLIGAAIALLALLKVTYGAALLGLLAVSVVLGVTRLAQAAVALAAGAALTALLAITTGQVGAYLADLAFVAEIGRPLLNPALVLRGAGEAAVWLGLAALVYLMGTGLRGARPSPRPLALMAATAAMAYAILLKNHWVAESPVYALLLLLALDWSGALAPGEDRPSDQRAPVLRLAILALGLGLALSYPVRDGGTLLAQHIELGRAAASSELADTPLGGVVVDPYLLEGGDATNTLAVHAKTLNGLAALRRIGIGRESGPVLAFSFANPFPALLGTAPPARTPIWLHAGFTFSRQVHWPADALLAGVEVVMVARGEVNANALWDIYGAAVERDFRLVERGDTWLIYRRTP